MLFLSKNSNRYTDFAVLISTGKFPAACCGFEERFFGFQPQNDIGLSWVDFPHQTSSEPQSNSDP